MNKRIMMIVFTCIAALMLFSLLWIVISKREPIVIEEYVLLEEKTVDDIIAEAELILIGTVSNVLPSRWDTPDGNVPINLTLEEIYEDDLGIFTDTEFSIDQLLKGEIQESNVRVRSFRGEVGNVQWISDVEPIFINGNTYLLFLVQDYGPTSGVVPGDYISVNAIDAVYAITDAMAISPNDEWNLAELIAYIQNALQNSQ